MRDLIRLAASRKTIRRSAAKMEIIHRRMQTICTAIDAALQNPALPPASKAELAQAALQAKLVYAQAVRDAGQQIDRFEQLWTRQHRAKRFLLALMAK